MMMSLNKVGFRAFLINITASEHELHDKFVSMVNMLSGQWMQDWPFLVFLRKNVPQLSEPIKIMPRSCLPNLSVHK